MPRTQASGGLMKNVKLLVGVALFTIIFSTSTAAQAQAGFFNWTKDAKTQNTDESWSFDSLYQNIKNVSVKTEETTMRADAVTSVNSPVAVKSKSKAALKKTYIVSASAYSSSVDETDSTPFITASNTYVRDGIVAANFLPFGTAIKIPDIYGDKIFIVEDRMNRRYQMNVDLWFPSKALAKQFGRKTITIEVVS